MVYCWPTGHQSTLSKCGGVTLGGVIMRGPLKDFFFLSEAKIQIVYLLLLLEVNKYL